MHASPLPATTLVGAVPDNATMTTAITVSQIQVLLVSTPGVAYDIVPLVAPPASYNTAVNTTFLTRNQPGGTTVYDGAASGAFLHAGWTRL
jgi:hypothetical protein